MFDQVRGLLHMYVVFLQSRPVATSEMVLHTEDSCLPLSSYLSNICVKAERLPCIQVVNKINIVFISPTTNIYTPVYSWRTVNTSIKYLNSVWTYSQVFDRLRLDNQVQPVWQSN